MAQTRALIVGAGLAGLSCARHLHQAGLDVAVFEASDSVGGRVRTDVSDGFRLDRGFQVLLTAYPECRQQLDYDSLDLRTFFSGALVRYDGRFHRIADPWREPVAGLAGAFAPIGSLTDKLRIGRLRGRLKASSLDDIFSRPERSTLDALGTERFSSAMIERFFRPFLGGVFLERDLATSSRMFEFVFKMFSEGYAAVPASGMQAIPEQLAASLPASTIRTNSRVSQCRPGALTIESGETVEGDLVVIATDAGDAVQLVPRLSDRQWNSTTCFYFAASKAPITDPILVLNGDGTGPVNNLCVPSRVSRTYAPQGQELVSVTVVSAPETGDLEAEVREQLREWFGAEVDDWRLIRSYRIDRALPFQPPTSLEPPARPVRVDDTMYVCGDHLDTGSIQGAMVSGRRAAEAVLADVATRVHASTTHEFS